MTWLLMLILLTCIFTLALTTHYRDKSYDMKEEVVAMKEELRLKESEWQEILFREMTESNETIQQLQRELGR